MDCTDEVRDFYNAAVEAEWNRIADRPEFILTCRFIDRYVKAGDRVLDIGGGPGRYSFYLAQKGCDVTLLDLSEANVEFAAKHAEQTDTALRAVCGDARKADRLTEGLFDSVLLMGPLYHLLDEADRVEAVNAALRCLKPGGVLFASFISVYGGLIYMMKIAPEIILSQVPMEIAFRDVLINGESYSGDAFTKAFFVQPKEILPFMERFELEKLHLFGQEGVMSPTEEKVYSCGRQVVDAMLDFSESVCENDELMSWAEHIMYVGRKKG